MALSKSSNPGEAATALKQAIKLAEMHNINIDQLKFSDVNSFNLKKQNKKIASHEQFLISTILTSFNCEALMVTTISGYEYKFIGIGNKPEIAAYVFKTLMHKLKQKRSSYIKNLNNKSKSQKSYQGDVFSFGWITQMKNKIESFANPEEKQIVSDFLAIEYSNAENYDHKKYELKLLNKEKISRAELNAFSEGQFQAKKEQIHHGLNESNKLMELEQ